MERATASNQIAGQRESGTICPFCEREIRSGDGVSVCNACGAVHHRACWDGHGHCASYVCSSGTANLDGRAALVVSSEELARAVPLPPRTPRAGVGPGWISMPAEPPRTSRLAVSSFICALLGIPLFGLITGMLAIVLGSLALMNIVGTRLRGAPWAIIGVGLGVADVVGWLLFLFPLVEARLERRTAEFAPDLTALEGLDPVINRAMRANVVIESGAPGAFGRRGIGSGVILKIEQGEALILTNRHVIDLKFADGGAGRSVDDLKDAPLFVEMIGQQFQPARVVWVAPSGIDAALVRSRCQTTEAQAAIWSKGEPLHVGDPVFAIGNPHNLTWTHTQGTISQFRTQGEGPGRVRILQTQTAINQGNSGGGLYDKSGNLIGINTWTGDKSNSEGLSFAISFDSILDQSPPELPDKVSAKVDASQTVSGTAEGSGNPDASDKTDIPGKSAAQAAERKP